MLFDNKQESAIFYKCAALIVAIFYLAQIQAIGQENRIEQLKQSYSFEGDHDYVKVKWISTIKGEVHYRPKATGKNIYISRDDDLLSISPSDGSLEWVYKTEDKILSSPKLITKLGIKKRLIYIATKNTVHAVQSESGVREWVYQANNISSVEYAYSTTDKGALYITNEDRVSALNPISGQEEWEVKVESKITSSAKEASPLRGEGRDLVYIGAENKIYALGAESGEVQWISNIDNGNVKVISAGSTYKIYIGTGEGWGTVGKVIALEGDTGKKRGETDVEARYISCLLEGKNLYVCDSEGKAHAFNKESGEKRLTFNVQGVVSEPAYNTGYRNRLFFGTKTGSVHAFGTRMGAKKWRFNTGRLDAVYPEVGPRGIYIVSRTGNVYCLDWPGSSF